jgi:predicted nucleotidyltransferase
VSIEEKDLPISEVSDFCQRWKVTEFALFGSVLRPDFRPDSDIDVLVTFSPEATWSLFDFVTMQDELRKIFGREVDIMEREALRNPFRRRSILNSLQVFYAA